MVEFFGSAGGSDSRRRLMAILGGGVVLIVLVWLIAPGRRYGDVDADLERIYRMRDRKDVAGLTRAVQDSSPRIATEALAALVAVSGKNAPQVVQQAIADGRPEVRQAAAVQFANVGSRENVAALVELLKGDPAPQVRAAAAQSLGKLRSWAGLDAAIDALDDADLEVRRQAIAAVEKIMGVRFAQYRPEGPAAQRRAFQAFVRQRTPVAKEAYDEFMNRLQQQESRK